jgi:hypothetical protein
MGAPIAGSPLVVTAAATYTVTRSSKTVIFNGASAAATTTWTIPDPATMPDKEFKLSSNLGVVNFTVTGGTTIQSSGAALASMVTGQGVTIQSNGTNWYEVTQDLPLPAKLTSIAAAQTAASGAAGLVRSTSATAADLLPIGPVFPAFAAAANEGAARDAIGAETWRYPGSTLVTTLTATGLQQRSSDRSVWGPSPLSGTNQLLQTYSNPIDLLAATPGLILNGSCTIPSVRDSNNVARALNFGRFEAYVEDLLYGNYSLRMNSGATADVWFFDRLMAVELGFIYQFAGAFRQLANFSTGQLGYITLIGFDADQLFVVSDQVAIKAGSSTTLSAPVTNGATSIFINNSTQAWYTSVAPSYDRLINIYPYTNSKGQIYKTPANPSAAGGHYTRRQVAYANAIQGATTTELQLATPWALGPLPAGTEVANGSASVESSTYIYAGVDLAAAGGAWREISGACQLFDSTFPNVTKLRYGAVLVQVGWLFIGSSPIDNLTHMDVIAKK